MHEQFIEVLLIFCLSTKSACYDNAVGVSSISIIPDSFLKASTTFSSDYLPAFARLNDVRGKGGGWCSLAGDNTPNDWLQVDLGKIMEVCGVATQGNAFKSEWIKDFKLSFSSSGDIWEEYKDPNGATVVGFCYKCSQSIAMKVAYINFPISSSTMVSALDSGSCSPGSSPGRALLCVPGQNTTSKYTFSPTCVIEYR